ncbi:MAG: serine/threonine-protein kinase, partial [Myxococcota bacterium]
MLPRQPTKTFPYRIEKRIGEGAMGLVFRATEMTLGRPVAIKILHPRAMAELREEERTRFRNRFIQEARAAAALTHPGVTTIYRVDLHEGTPYIAMEWLEGEDLEVILNREGRLNPAKVAKIGVQLMEALDAAHTAGVIHRDIKPSNLILLKNGRLKIADFGIARVSKGELVKTMAGSVLGTPMFASPEQFTGHTITHSSDIFSAGVVLYTLLTGLEPFTGETVHMVGVNVVHADPRPIHHLNSEVPTGLNDVILKALYKSPADRWSNAYTMAEALRPYTIDPRSTPNPISPISGVHGVITGPNAPVRPLTHHNLPLQAASLIKTVLSQWPARPLGNGPTRHLLNKLQERPLHTAPFAGAVHIAGTLLLLLDGLILAAVDLTNGHHGDKALANLPERAQAVLY